MGVCNHYTALPDGGVGSGPSEPSARYRMRLMTAARLAQAV